MQNISSFVHFDYVIKLGVHYYIDGCRKLIFEVHF